MTDVDYDASAVNPDSPVVRTLSWNTAALASSNYEAWRLVEALWISDSKNLARFEAYQP